MNIRLSLKIVLSVALTSCSKGSVDSPASQAAVEYATEQGRSDAAIVADSTASLMERERAIIDIRNKEAHMRAMGYDKAADAYILGAEEVIPDSIK